MSTLNSIIKTTLACLPAFALVAGVATARADIVSTIESATSGSTVSLSGTYTVSVEIAIPTGVTLKGPATFVFTNHANDGLHVQTSRSGVTIESVTVKGAYHGIQIEGPNCKITSCTATGNYNTGIQCENGEAANETVSGCTSYDNQDTDGGNADGFGVKQGTGTGITVSNCTAYGNSDDGFDFEKSANPVTCSNCLSYTEGRGPSGIQGNGVGFKMGIKGDQTKHIMISDVAHNNTGGNTADGFDSNDNTGGIHLTTCHSYSNLNMDRLQNCTLTNCTMQTTNL